MTEQRAPAAEPRRLPDAEPEQDMDLEHEARLEQEVRREARSNGGGSAPERQPDTRDLRDAQAAAETSAAYPSEPARTSATSTGGETPLFDVAAGHDLQERWLTIQTEFVDAPRDAVEKADALVAEVLKKLTESFARERDALEAAWSRGDDGSGDEASTEDLRQTIRRYRSFFNRLLSL